MRKSKHGIKGPNKSNNKDLSLFRAHPRGSKNLRGPRGRRAFFVNATFALVALMAVSLIASGFVSKRPEGTKIESPEPGEASDKTGQRSLPAPASRPKAIDRHSF